MEDKEVMEMVNENAAKAEERRCEGRGDTVEQSNSHGRDTVRAFLLMAVKALLWVLMGMVVLALVLSGHQMMIAAACVCVCIAAAAIHVDRYLRKR